MDEKPPFHSILDREIVESDPVRDGGVALVKSRVAAPHPVAWSQAEGRRREREERLAWMAQTYGAHVPMRLLMEEEAMRQAQNADGALRDVPSLGWEVLSGALETLEWEEVLDRPEEREGREASGEQLPVHVAMERWHGVARERRML